MLPLELIDYHLGEKNHLPLGIEVAKLQLAIIALSLAGFLYEPPAAQHGHTNTGKILNVLGTCYTATFMCYVATDIFVKQHIQKQYVPTELINIVEAELTAEEYVRQWWIIGIFAFLSSMPYAMTAVVYRFDPTELFVVYCLYIATATTLLHFLPVKLTLAHPIYGAPPRWCLQLWNTMMLHQITQKERKKIDDKNRLSAKRRELAGKVRNAKDHFLASLVPALGKIDGNELSAYLEKSNQEKFDHLMTFDIPMPQLPVGLTYLARFLGAIIELGASLGYAANPYLLLQSWVGFWWLAALISAPSLYLFGVLTAFFGDLFGLKILTDLGLWGENVIKLPIEFRVYPKLMLCAIVINLFCIVFAAAAAQEMMERALSSRVSPQMMAMLGMLVQIGITILAWYGPLDFQKLIIKYIAQYTQKNDSGKLMELTSKIEALESDILRLTSKVFSDEVNDEEKIDQNKPDAQDATVTIRWGWGCFSWQHKKNNTNQPIQASLLRSRDEN